MATRTLKPLSSESAIALANRAAAGRALGIVLLRLPEDAAEDAFNVVVCGLVFVRQGGFMVTTPPDEEVKSIIEVMGSEHEIAPLFHAGQVECETTRGKNMGTFPCLLVDFPWEMVEHFVAGSSAKSGDMKDLRALQFAGTGTLLRAGKDSSFQLASAWIGSHMPEEVAQDYLTGEEQDEREDEEELQEAPPNGAPLPSQVSALQQRIKELEAQLNQDPSAAVQLHPKLGASSKAPPLFGPAAPTSSLSAQDWNRLQRLAGPPPKMHASEMRRPAPGANTTAAENIYAGLDREAEEAGPVNQQLELLGQIDANADPLHKLMFAQLQQNQIFAAKTGSASPSRSCAVRVGRRIGQRRRQWIRSQRMYGERGVRQVDERFESHSSGGGGECSKRTGPYTRKGGHELDEEVCRATHAASRESPAYLHHVPPHRCMVGGVFHRECGPDGSCVEDPGFCRADLPGLRPNAVILAANRPAGTTAPDFDVEPETGRFTTVFPSCCSSVDLSESCIRQRFGYPGVESFSSGQRQQDQGGGSECRHRSIGQTKEAAKDPKGQTRKGQGRQGWRQQHRSRLGACNSEEQFLSQHGSHRPLEASPHDRPAKSHRDKLPNYPIHDTTDSYFPNLDSPSGEFNSIDLGEAIVKLFWSSHTGLKAFAQSCMQEAPCIVDERSHSLWPVPIPRWSWTGNSRLGPRRRKRRRYFHVRYRLLQIVIASLNWEVLGFVTSAPTRARIGSFISPAQHSIIERFERALDHFLHAPDFTGDELGRPFSKFQSIISVLKGLPKCDFSVENLYDCLVQVHDSLNHYSSHFGKTSHHSADDDQIHQCSFEHGPAVLQAVLPPFKHLV